METFEEIKKILVDEFDCDSDYVTPTAKLSFLGLDSGDLINLCILLEEEFDVIIQERKFLGSVNIVQDLVNVVEYLKI